MRKFLYTLLFISAITACKKDDTLRYNNVTMGNIDGESIISDQGNIFHVAQTPFEIKFEDYKRVLVVCDVLKETAEKTYDIRLTGIANVLDKKVKTMEDSTEEEPLTVSDPVRIQDIWYSGGYLNIAFDTAYKNGSETTHFINLVREESEKEGTYVFSFLHNAQGEVPTETDKGTYTVGGGYASFHIASIIEGDSAKIVLKWKSHKFNGYGFSLTESEDMSKEYSWTRGGHEHAPRELVLKSTVGIQ